MAQASTSHSASFLDISSVPQPSLPVDKLSFLRRPRSSVTGHYRTHSTFISEDLTESPTHLRPGRRSSIRPSSSFGSMGFSFKERIKESKEVKRRQGRPRNLSDSTEITDNTIVRPMSPPRSSTSPITSFADRPLSSHGLFTLPRSKGLKKKRSLASLLSAASENNIINIPIVQSISASGSLGSSPLGTLAPISASPVDEQPSNGHDDVRRPPHKHNNNFVRKNTWLKRENRKVHPYPLEAPYMQAYDPILLENERYTNDLLRRLNSNEVPSFHNYGRKTPLYTLDLGCGSGHWLLDASSVWKNSQHTGFDLVDTLIPELRKQDNIQFVRGNFLNSLPFPDKSFDFVRMANLTLCIPYNKWEDVISEVRRVLTIDGRLELVDDQIFFPYGQTSTISTSTTPRNLDDESSFFDLDDDDFDDEGTIGGDSVEDGDSMSTESTLVSDGDTSVSSHKTRPVPIKGISPEPRPPPLNPDSLSLDDPETPTSTVTITIEDASITARPSPWGIEVASARDMETVFESMLNKRFGIHTRPSDFVADIMKHVFGNGRKIKSCHLKLAPRDAIIGALNNSTISVNGRNDSVGAVNEKDEKIIGDSVVGQMISEVKPWFSVDKVKDERKRHKMTKKIKKIEGLDTRSPRSSDENFTPSSHVPLGISAKAAGRLGISGETAQYGASHVPTKITAKAASRLGIKEGPPSPAIADNASSIDTDDEPGDGSLKDSVLTEPSVDTVIGVESEISPVKENRLSAKAAGRLGISYSELAEAAAGSTRRTRSSTSSFSVKSSNAVQSPGLVFWPNLYIPLSPVELEMHACKHIHTLLGCKPALAEYIKTYVDEQGECLAKDDEFDQAIWDYECFRRRRFHWPSEAPEWDLAPTESFEELSPRSAKSPTTRTASASNADPTAPRKISDSPHGPYMCDELTHVRTIRIYEAVKTDDYSLASLPFPRSPAPSPPTA